MDRSHQHAQAQHALSNQHARPHAGQYAPEMLDILSQTLSISTANESSFHSDQFPPLDAAQGQRVGSFTAHSPIDTASPGSAGCPPSPYAPPRVPVTAGPARGSITAASRGALDMFSRIAQNVNSTLRQSTYVPARSSMNGGAGRPSPGGADLSFMMAGAVGRTPMNGDRGRSTPNAANLSHVMADVAARKNAATTMRRTSPTRTGTAGRQSPKPTRVRVSAAAAGPKKPLAKRPAKRHTCLVCNKQFKRAHNLKIHGRMHTNELPFACPEAGCGKAFKWKSSIVSHAKWHAKLAAQTQAHPDGPATAAVTLRTPGRKPGVPRAAVPKSAAFSVGRAPRASVSMPMPMPTPTPSSMPLLPPMGRVAAPSPAGSAASASAPPPAFALAAPARPVDGVFHALAAGMSPPLRMAAAEGFSAPPVREVVDMPGLLRFSDCTADYFPDPEPSPPVHPLDEDAELDVHFDGFAFLKDGPV